MFFTVDTRKTGDKDGFRQHGIEMTPLLFGGLVIDAAGFSAFRAPDVLSCIGKVYYHLLTEHGQIYILHFPGYGKSEELLLMGRQALHNE